jgi:hypothetical protein
VVVLLEEVPSQLRDSNIITRAVVLLHSLLLALLNQFSFRPLGHPLLDERRGGEHLTENKIESRGMSPLADRLPDREAWYFSEWFYFNASTGICTTQEG